MSRRERQILAVILAVVIFLLGFGVGNRTLSGQHLQQVIVNKDLGQTQEVDFSLYWQVWEKAKEKYLGQPDAKKSLYGAIKGMVASLSDPFSVFFTPDEAKQFFSDLNGEFEGIGAELAIKDSQLTVVAPLEDSPAEKAGLKPKDVILAVDGVDSVTVTFDEAIAKIRGEKGSQVKLLVQREGVAESFEMTITRAKIKVDPVRTEIREDGIGLMRIIQFSDDTLSQVKIGLDKMEKAGVKGMVLDLRNNPGGLLDSCIEVTSYFIPAGVVVIEEGKSGTRTEFKTTQKQLLAEVPLVVLINEGSASAAEIMAGAIQDSGRGKLVGIKSFGKGTVQDMVEFGDGSNLKITVARWLTPGGHEINNQGIEPDIEVKMTDEDVKNEKDPQLDKAIELLKS